MTLTDSIRGASHSLAVDWVGACERLLLAHGATPVTHVLVSRRVPDGQDAWVRLVDEDPAPVPGQLMLQMRTEGTTITIRIVETPT